MSLALLDVTPESEYWLSPREFRQQEAKIREQVAVRTISGLLPFIARAKRHAADQAEAEARAKADAQEQQRLAWSREVREREAARREHELADLRTIGRSMSYQYLPPPARESDNLRIAEMRAAVAARIWALRRSQRAQSARRHQEAGA